MQFTVTMATFPEKSSPVPYQELRGRSLSLPSAYDRGWHEVTVSRLQADTIGFLIHDETGKQVGKWKMGDDDDR